MSRRLQFLGLVLLAGCQCSGETQPPVGAAFDAGGADTGDAGDEEDAGEPWDPKWHETQAKQWETLDTADAPECGEGCRVGLHMPGMHPSYYGHANKSDMLADVNTDEVALFFGKLGGSTSVLRGVGSNPRRSLNEALVFPTVWGDFVSYLHRPPRDTIDEPERYHIEVMNTKTGEVKITHSYTRKGEDLGVTVIALNDEHVFWNRVGSGVMGRNLQTGEVRHFLSRECSLMCATPKGLLCFGPGNYFIDQETGEGSEIEPGGSLACDSSCSADRSRIIWVDYRDPPGPGSDYFAPRRGGEVYMKDLVTGEFRRLTHDSPDNPRAKAFPAVGEELAAWKEVHDGWDDPNPETAQDLYAAARDLVVLDLNTKAKCRIRKGISEYFQFMSVHGRWVYGVGGSGHIIGIDVDHPAIGCEAY